MLKRFLFTACSIFTLLGAYAQEASQASASGNAQMLELLLTGINNGKNVYVQNPLSADGNSYCTQAVYLNGSLLFSNPRASAFTIKVDQLPQQSPVEIKIVYGAGCMPKIINPTAIRASTGFRYLAINITEDKIFWTTNGEQRAGKFFVEKGQKENWVPESTVNAQPSYNNYQAEINHYSGDNEYRIRFLQDDGQMFYSRVTAFNSTAEPIKFTPKRVADIIYLSRSTDYQVRSVEGEELLRGNGKEIKVGSLPTGVYYLLIENREEKFFKK